MNRIRTTRVAVLAVGLAASLAAGLALVGPLSRESRELTIHRSHTTPVTDLSDDRKLVGVAHSVFFGEVLARAGQTEDEFPETQFEVKVTEVIKGSVNGIITVNQHGGFRQRGKELVLSEGDTLLEPGQTYLLVTRNYPEKGWHTLVPAHGDLKVHGADHANRLRQRFRAAHHRQVPFDSNP